MDKTQNSFQYDINNHNHLNIKRQKNFNDDLNLITNSLCTNDSNNKLPNKSKKLKTSPTPVNTMFNNNGTDNEIPQQLTQTTSFRFEYPNPLIDNQQQQQHRQIEQNQLDFRNSLNYYDEEEEEDDDEDDEDDEEDEEEDEDDEEEEEELDDGHTAENGRLTKQKKTSMFH